MCPSACKRLYSPNTPLNKVTCPCGKGYWDIFKQRFVDGASVRKGEEPSRENHEARVRRTYSPDKYEAILRHQWIIHFLDCEIKTQMDAGESIKGRDDGSTLRLAMAELQEFSMGDYSGWRRRAASVGPIAVTSGRHGARDSSENVFDRRNLDTSRASAAPIFPRDTNPFSPRHPAPPQSYFVSAQLVSLDVLKHHQQEGTFGKWKAIEQTIQEGKPGFFIRSDTPLGKDAVERLVEDTKKVESARKGTKAGGAQRKDSKELPPGSAIGYSPPNTKSRHGGLPTDRRHRDESSSDDEPVERAAKDIHQLQITESRRPGGDRRPDPEDRGNGRPAASVVSQQRHSSRYKSEEERERKTGRGRYHQ